MADYDTSTAMDKALDDNSSASGVVGPVTPAPSVHECDAPSWGSPFIAPSDDK